LLDTSVLEVERLSEEFFKLLIRCSRFLIKSDEFLDLLFSTIVRDCVGGEGGCDAPGKFYASCSLVLDPPE